MNHSLVRSFVRTARLLKQHFLFDQPIWGLATLGSRVFVIEDETSYVDVYSRDNFRSPLFSDYLVDLGTPVDMTSSTTDSLVFVSDSQNHLIHRIDLLGRVSVWPVGAEPHGISVTGAGTLLVTCPEIRTVREFAVDGTLLGETVLLKKDIIYPWHTIELDPRNGKAYTKVRLIRTIVRETN